MSVHHSRHRKHAGLSPTPSRYRKGMIPTENLKFDQFLEVVFNSTMPNSEIKEEIRDYVLVLETNYMETIGNFKNKATSVARRVSKEKGMLSSQLA